MRELSDFSEAIKVALIARDIDGWLLDTEAIALYLMALRGSGKGEIVEIGSFKGKSTYCLAKGAMVGRREKVTSVDTHQGSSEHQTGRFASHLPPGGTEQTFRENMKNHGVDKYINVHVATSEKVAKKWKKPIRLLFIDGAHEYDMVEQDYALWEPFVVRNGLIAFHDSTGGFVGPTTVVNKELYGSDKFKNITTIGSMTIATKIK